MIDRDIGGASWLELPAGKYKILDNPTSTAQIEAEILYVQTSFIYLTKLVTKI
jgi:hypothetical protein